MSDKKLQDIGVKIQKDLEDLDPVQTFKVLIGLLSANILDVAASSRTEPTTVAVWIIEELGRMIK